MSKKNLLIPGFRFSGVSAGIKETRTLDLALIHSVVPSQVVGTFTTGKVQAAPVLVSKKNIRSGLCSAVIVNSGNANACTGERGMKDAKKMVAETAGLLKVPIEQVLVSSTGKIGIPLPIEKIVKKIPDAVRQLSPRRLLTSAEAILTTDDSVKVASASGTIFGTPYHLAGFAKGAGMIEPHMKLAGQKHATMLAYIVTDAFLPRSVMEVLFGDCVEETFNRITVDGDMSTNDTALFLANGVAGNRPFQLKTPECRLFAQNLFGVMESLAKQMVIDGEGATKCVRIEVKGAKNDEEARRIAYTIGNSLLVKTAFFGQDPNWGRIMGALGRAEATLDPHSADIFYNQVCVAKGGISTGSLKDREAKKVMRQRDFTVTVDLHLGSGTFGIYASDLSLDYVKLNSCYRT